MLEEYREAARKMSKLEKKVEAARIELEKAENEYGEFLGHFREISTDFHNRLLEEE